MTPLTTAFVQALALAAMVVGLVGLFVPVLPGPALIWAGAAIWAWGDGFVHVGWQTLLLLAALAAAAEVADIALTAWGARRGGIPFRSLAATALGALVGTLVLAMPGALLGAMIVLVAVERRRQHGDTRAAVRSARVFLVAYAVSLAIQVVLGFAMAFLFLVQAAPGL